MALQTISFGTIGRKNLDRIDDGDTLRFDEIAGVKASLLPKDVNFYALVGDGDRMLEPGETAHKLGDTTLLGDIVNRAASVTADDPVRITAHGWLGRSALGDLSDALVFRDGAFGLANGRDGLVRDGFLNGGDSLSFDVGERQVTSLRFTADLLGHGRSATTTLLLDLDGDVVRPGARRGTTVEHALVALPGIHDGDKVELDFADRVVRVNGHALALDAGALFDAFEAAGGHAVTIGSRSGKPVALENLVIDTDDAAAPPVEAPVATPDVIRTNAILAEIPEWLLLANDRGNGLQITSVTGSGAAPSVSFDPTAATDDVVALDRRYDTHFDYTIRDADGQTAASSIDLVTSTTLSGLLLSGDSGRSDDILIGGRGNTVFAPGAGSDTAIGGADNDSFNYVVGERAAGDVDAYYGGAGTDTLRFLATAAEREALQPELAAFQAHLAADPDQPFTFASLGLTVHDIERLELRSPGAAILTTSGIDPIPMGSTQQGDTSRVTLLVANVGEGTATDIEVTWTGPFDNYPVNDTLTDELGGGQSAVQPTIFVAPAQTGRYEGQMQISYFDGEQTVVATHDFWGMSI